MNKQYKVKKTSMLKQADFMRRVFTIAAWLKRRYKLEYEECDFEYFLIKDEKDFLKISLTFK